MAEGFHFTGEDSNTETDETKSKKKKSSVRLGVSATATVEKPAEVAPVEKPKNTAWEKLLAGLSLEKPPKQAEKAAAERVFLKTEDNDNEKLARSNAQDERIGHESLPAVPAEGEEFIVDLHDETVLESPVISVRETTVELPEDVQAEETPEMSTAAPVAATKTPRKPFWAPKNAGGGAGGTRPPAPPGGSTASSASSPFGGLPRMPWAQNYNIAPSSTNTFNELLSQQRAVAEAEYYGRQRGRGEALVGGIIIGALIEHFRHKGRERKMEKLAKQTQEKQAKEITGLKTEALEQARKAEAERYQQKAAAKEQLATTARAQISEAAALKHAQEVKRYAEQQEHQKAELIDRLNAQAAEQEQQEAERELNPESHIETSAWHAIEVDKSGHAVQDTAIEYGHEYYQERAHEAGPKDVVSRDTVTGAAALTAATLTQSNGQAGAGGSGNAGTASAPRHTAASADDIQRSPAPVPDAEDYGRTTFVSLLPLIVILAFIVLLIIVLL